jgi:hypothetical protein
MKTIKVLLPVIIMITLIFGLMGTVIATDSTLILQDKRGDVIDDFGDIADKPNIDILELTIIKEGKSVEIELIVDQEIENRGDLESLRFYYGDIYYENDEDYNDLINKFLNNTIDVVGYSFFIITDETEYTVYYANNEIYVGDMYSLQTLDADFSVTDNTLIISFNMLNETEILYDIYGETIELIGDMINEQFEFYEDTVFFEPLSTLMQAPNLGEVNEPIEFNAEVIGGQEPYSFEWDFGDGETSTEQNPTHIFTNEGKYDVSVIVTDRLEEIDIQTSSIEIIGESASTPGFEILTIFVSIITLMVAFYIVKRK